MNRRPFLKSPLRTLRFIAFLYSGFAALFLVLLLLLNLSKGVHSQKPDFERYWHETQQARLTILLFGCAIAGLMRAAPTHPRLSSSYGNWLRTTPWRPGMDLPLGPINWVWEDLLLIVPLIALSIWDFADISYLPFAAYLATYSLISVLTMRGDRAIWARLAWLFLWSCTLLWPQCAWILIAAISALSQWAMRNSVVDFQSESVKPPKALRKKHLSSLGWPMTRVGPTPPAEPLRSRFALTGAALIGWLLFVCLTVADRDSPVDPNVILWVVPTFGVLIAFFRGMLYFGKFAPPISLWGRIRTGRLIIPGYDQILITPAAMCVAAICVPLLLQSRPFLSAALTTAVVFGIGFIGGPSLRRWNLTGQYQLTQPHNRLSHSEP